MAITNDMQLQQVMINDLNSIIDEVTEKLLKNLQDSIETIVYGAGEPTTYKRNRMDGGLQGSFEKEDAQTAGLAVNSKIDHDPMSMKLDVDNYVHGSNDWYRNDIRDILAEIIIEGKSGPRFGKKGFWREPRDFWEPFIKELNKNGNKFIEEAFIRRGIISIKK